MLTKVRKTIETHRMLQSGEHVLVGVSGGADSVTLLAVLQQLGPAFGLTLTAAHFNHGMREAESDRDEAFVRFLCERRRIPLLTGSLGATSRTPGLSVEDFLRRERYAFFETASQSIGAHRVALGHHRGDQAETILMNLIRGSGLTGLGGIPPVRGGGRFIRPLIECSTLEIAGYLEEEGLSFIVDGSNTDERYLRNRVRRTLLPLLERRFNPSIVDSLCRLADVFRLEDDYMRGAARSVLESWPRDRFAATIPLREYRSLHPALKRRIVLEIVRGLAGTDCAVGWEHVKNVLDLAEAGNSSGWLDLPGSLRVRKNSGSLEFGRTEYTRTRSRDNRRMQRPGDPFSVAVLIPGTVRIESLGISMRFRKLRRVPSGVASVARKAYMDLERISFPLVLRSARPGDRIQPIGMKGTKKLNRLFIDEKVPRDQRSRIPVLADGISILWIPGLRLSERVRIDEGTSSVLMAEII